MRLKNDTNNFAASFNITPPYQMLVLHSKINKRKHELYELHINEQEAEIVRLIFDKYVYEGYGAQRIATYLNNAGYRARSGKCWHPGSLRGMVGNLTYMANLVYEMILSGELDPKQLTVTFIDEEGLYPSMVDAAYRWRRNFLSVGAKFLWFCLPFKQVSVIDHLSSSESWITWEPGKEDVWMRKPPDFAIMYSPYLHYAGEMNYQTFCSKAFSDGIQLVGLRTAESLTRFKCIANTKMERITRGGKFYPIYDWKDSDVWLYIKERNLEFPEIYMRLYEAGVRKNALRLCAFFGDCGTQGLRWIAETDNDLWERIQRREPNAYLVLLYWDSEMFRRTTRKRGELEEESEKKDYKALCKDLLFLHPERYTIAKDTLSHIEHWRGLFIKTYGIAEQKHYKTMYEGLLYGDPKMRILRILWTTIYNDHNARIKEEQNHGKH